MKRASTKTANGLILARGKWYLRKSFRGTQREISLATNCKSTAKQRATRFIATAQSDGFETAMEELRGRPLVKKGEDPTFGQMELLYREFCTQSARPPRVPTIKHNLGCLRRLMTACGADRVSLINPSKLVMTNNGTTASEKRSFASQVSCASNVFKKSALRYYKARGLNVSNPFANMEVPRPKLEPYSPLPPKERQAIWEAIDTTLAPVDAMIVLLALAAGLRRSEIEAAEVAWLTPREKNAILTIQETKSFVPKSGESRIVPISHEVHRRLLSLRERVVCDLSEVEETRATIRASRFLVPVIQRKGSGGRLWGRFASVAAWLRSMGVKGQKPLHSLRKEFGSVVATEHGIFDASKLLGHADVKVTQVHYASLIRLPDLDIGKLIQGPPKKSA